MVNPVLRFAALWFFIHSFCCFGQAAQAQNWEGPRDGPIGQPAKKVIYIASDFRNGGVAGVYRGLQSAAIELGWSLTEMDGKGDLKALRSQLLYAIQSAPDGIVLSGFQSDYFRDLIALAKGSRIVMVGWHAAEKPGPNQDLFVNISTDALAVAEMAAQYAIENGNEKIGAVLFNDSHFSIANLKTKRMKEVIGKCKSCKVLSVEDLAISNASQEIPAAIPRLNAKFGRSWTHSLAVNDVYFDHMNYPLYLSGRTDIQNIAAGDGSIKALSRIRSGLSQQIATIAEPLMIQGWQTADELNRAFSGKLPSGYVTQPLLITSQLLKNSDKNPIDLNQDYPDYKAAYRAIWKGRTSGKR